MTSEVIAGQVQLEGDLCRLSGVIDFETAPGLLAEVAKHLEPNRELVVDFSDVTQANSAAIALLLEWRGLAARNNGHLIHQNLPESIRQLSEICQVSALI